MTTNAHPVLPAHQTSDMAVSCLGPDASVAFVDLYDRQLKGLPWLGKVRGCGKALHGDIMAARNSYYMPMIAKGITRFPIAMSLQLWRHWEYQGNIYVHDGPEVLIISPGKTPVLMTF